MTARPRVRVNQLGYLPNRPKHATLISDAKDPIRFTVQDQSGIEVFTGFSEPWSVRPEPTSGLMVHVLDFSNLWTTCLAETRSVRVTSLATASTTAATNGLGSLVTILIQHFHRHHGARWPVARTPGQLRTFPTTLAFWAFRLSAATSTSPPPRSPMTSAAAGIHR
jgi:hypothetical protein